MRISFLERFRRQCRSLSRQEQTAVLDVLLELEQALSRPHEHKGIGLRKLHPTGIWEARVGLSLRVLFELSHDEAILIFVGTHDEVKRFLRSLG